MFTMITTEEYKELVIKAHKYDESQEKCVVPKEEHRIEKVEIQKITPKEMSDILDNLKDKILGEDK